MFYQPFHEIFPNIAEAKTRNITPLNNPILPKGQYFFSPAYCKDKKCDCRRTLINVIHMPSIESANIVATISYGWEPMSFYRNWGSYLSEAMLREFKGPVLDKMQPQSAHAPYFLNFFKQELMKDAAYMERIQRFYAYAKVKQKMSLPKELSRLVNYDEDCPCESGRPLGKCCLKKTRRLKRRNKW
ncbi:MAG: hypothetical protein AAF806_14205 [Bacteroidota bacterium]